MAAVPLPVCPCLGSLSADVDAWVEKAELLALCYALCTQPCCVTAWLIWENGRPHYNEAGEAGWRGAKGGGVRTVSGHFIKHTCTMSWEHLGKPYERLLQILYSVVSVLTYRINVWIIALNILIYYRDWQPIQGCSPAHLQPLGWLLAEIQDGWIRSSYFYSICTWIMI